MAEINTLSAFISSIGFPIAVCCICFWYINKQQLRHQEEMDKLKDAINNNTNVMRELIAKLTD